MVGKTAGKIMSVILTLAMAMSFIPAITLTASAASDTWDGSADISWHNGGSSFTLTTAEQLAGLASIVNAGTDDFNGDTITLGADIDLSGHNWTPIGTSAYFAGTFNGDGHVVSSMSSVFSSSSDNLNIGLFGCLDIAGTVKNLGVTGTATAQATGATNSAIAGGLAAENDGVIINCFSQVNVTAASSGTAAYAGGLVGSCLGEITNCYATGNVSSTGATQSFSGVLIGYYGFGTVSAYYNSDAAITVNGSSATTVGDGSGLIAPTAMTSAQMKEASFVTILNTNKGSGNNSWAAVTDGYPTFTAPDTIAPTILSASRTDDTLITVTLSEACQNLAKANDGGFAVTKTGTATTYAVSATAQGADSSHVVLTVADMGTAGAAGVTVTYTAGVNGTIADMAGNALATDGAGKTVAAWDTTPPTVSSINRQTPSTATTNATSVVFRVTFSEAVTGVDISDFTLTAAETASGTIASVSASSGTTIDVTVNTISGAGTLRLDLNDSGTGITDVGGTAIAAGYASGQTYTIDTVAPTASVSAQTVKGGAGVTVRSTETGTVYLIGSSLDSAAYDTVSKLEGLVTGGTATKAVIITANTDTTISAPATSGTYAAVAADDAGNISSKTTDLVTVDATAPTIIGGGIPSNGTYLTGQNLDFTVNFSEAVSINTDSGTPYLTLTVGGTAVHASYLNGSGSSLVFRYTVVPGDYDADGIALSSDITLNGGTIRDAAGNDAIVTYPGTTLANIRVDAVAPTISGVAGPSDGTYTAGNLTFTVTFSEAVTVTNTPYIRLTIGSSTVNAAYVSGTGTTSLAFQYTIVSGNADSDGIACISPIVLPAGAAIKDAAGNDANLAFTPPTTSAVLVDALAPTISSAAIVSGNSYIDIVFSEGVYGANDGVTALTAAQLALTFTQNGGSATNVTISSIKKNDNAAETSASALTGGETTVRVFLSVTGSASGTETIEIKPATASSVYDCNGNAMASAQTTGAKTLIAPVSCGGDSGSSSSGSGAAVIVNGESKTAGTSQTTTDSSGQTTTTVTVDTGKLQTILDSQSSGATVIIPITGNPDVAAGTLTGAMVKSMEDKDATLVVQTDSGTYTLPASEIDIDAVSQQLGTNVTLSDIKVTVSISEPSASMTQVIENAAQDGGFTIMVPAVEYTISCTYGSQTVNVSSFNAYVERTIVIPDGVDPTKITTGVVVDPDGTTHHVPTRVAVINGKYCAVINSLTNSAYSVVWNQVEFSDVTNHWAKAAINDMGSRMIVTGVGNKNYAPDRNMTRAEFATIMVRALGLAPGTGASGFGDVAAADWYSGYIKTAASYGIIKGYDNGNFGTNDTITREQAMTMMARAMKITGLTVSLTDSDVSTLIGSYTDGESASDYAEDSIAACLKGGITSGTGNATISPKADITRAEVAVMVQRLLQKSGLI